MADVLTAAQQGNLARGDQPLRTLTKISAGHLISHFHPFVVPLLFPFLKDQLGVGYIELGFALTVQATIAGLTQAPMGYIVDRFGARQALLTGLTIGGLSLMLLGMHLSYSWLIGCSAFLGLAASVYHPADYAILTAHMDEARMGRAFSIHTFAGLVGNAIAPGTVAALAALGGGKGALIACGAIGPLLALVLLIIGLPDAKAADRKSDDASQKISVMTPAIIVLTIFFALLCLSTAGIASFGLVAFVSGYGISLTYANVALTAFFGCSAIGVLAGGFLADHTERHGQFAAVCFAVNAIIVFVIGATTLPLLLLISAMAVAGFLSGVISPSRDMMVRNAAPPGAAGRAFGIVSTGLHIGTALSPLLFGWIMDRNLPHWVFIGSAVFMMITFLLALGTDRKPRANPQMAAS